jgi:hypothetical protein
MPGGWTYGSYTTVPAASISHHHILFGTTVITVPRVVLHGCCPISGFLELSETPINNSLLATLLHQNILYNFC